MWDGLADASNISTCSNGRISIIRSPTTAATCSPRQSRTISRRTTSRTTTRTWSSSPWTGTRCRCWISASVDDVVEDRLQGQLLRPERRHTPDLRRDHRVRRSRQVPCLADRQLGQDRVQPGLPQYFFRGQPAAGRPANFHHVRLGHQRAPRTTGWLPCRAIGWPRRKSPSHRSGKLAQHRRRGRLLVRQLHGRRRLHPARRNGRSAVNDRYLQHRHAAVPDQGQLQDQQAVDGDRRERAIRMTSTATTRCGVIRATTPTIQYIPERTTPCRRTTPEYRCVRQPQLQEQHLLVDGDVQVRHANPAAGSDAGRGNTARQACRLRDRRPACSGSGPNAPALARQAQKITLDSKVLFDFDKAVLKLKARRRSTARSWRLAQVQSLKSSW